MYINVGEQAVDHIYQDRHRQRLNNHHSPIWQQILDYLVDTRAQATGFPFKMCAENSVNQVARKSSTILESESHPCTHAAPKTTFVS